MRIISADFIKFVSTHDGAMHSSDDGLARLLPRQHTFLSVLMISRINCRRKRAINAKQRKLRDYQSHYKNKFHKVTMRRATDVVADQKETAAGT